MWFMHFTADLDGADAVIAAPDDQGGHADVLDVLRMVVVGAHRLLPRLRQVLSFRRHAIEIVHELVIDHRRVVDVVGEAGADILVRGRPALGPPQLREAGAAASVRRRGRCRRR